MPGPAAKAPGGAVGPKLSVVQSDRPQASKGDWRAGDKAQHGKWGIGTVVEVRGTGDDQELKIAFPGQGIRQLMVKFAPLNKV